MCTKPKSTHWNINFESLSKQICIISMYYQVQIHFKKTIFYDCTTNVTSIQQPLRQRFSKCQSNFSQYPIVCMAKIVVLNVPITMMSLSVFFSAWLNNTITYFEIMQKMRFLIRFCFNHFYMSFSFYSWFYCLCW
jgi:hypothetical protein